jgi:hypothetical protein
MPKLGKTGRFPRGHLNQHDEGELQIGVAADTEKGVVILNFGTPVAWTALPPRVARQLGEALIKQAETVEAAPPAKLPS